MANPFDERDLEEDLFRIYQEGGKLGYWARYFYRLFMTHSDLYIGGVAAVRKMLEAGGAASGLAAVLSLERPDLAVETLVLSEEWGHLFKPWDRRQAQENLRLAKALLNAQNSKKPTTVRRGR
jgi:hypothetical protein